jgi:glycosyltransferase involved in cell wall biosynthesis
VLAEADAGLMVLRDAELFSFGVSPNKLFDYLGAGLPVVCNVPGEVAELARASGAGVQAADASAGALADAVARLAGEGAEARAAMGQAGREWVAREHGREVLAERLDAALRPLLGR